MGKATEAPKCKACGKAHWGTCMDHENRGYLSASRAEPAPPAVRAQRIAKAEEVIGSTKPNTQKASGKARKAPGRKAPRKGIATLSESKPQEGSAASQDGVKPAPSPSPQRGRPKSITDMKAYKAQKERERRAKKKPTT